MLLLPAWMLVPANAHEIWASHNTITGSIGIFGLLPTFDRALNEIGINSDGVKTLKDRSIRRHHTTSK